MTRQMLKTRAMTLIQTVRPPVMLVAFVLVAVGWLFSLLEQRIGASPFYIDFGALESMDTENVFGMDMSRMTFAGVSITFLFQAMAAFLDYGFVRYCLNVHRGKPSGVSDLFSGFENAGKVFLLWVLEFILLGLLSLLFVVPAVMAAYAWSMSRRLLCDHPDWSPVRCMRESRTLMQGSKWKLFRLHLSFFGWFILMAIVPAAAVFTEPYLGLTECGFYRSLIGDREPSTPEEKTDNTLPPREM